jgi:uncharacterized oxidoreductase
MKLTDNTIFITGGGSGIGRGLAEAFHKLGNTVIIGGRRRALLDEVVAANPGMHAVELDVTNPASIEQVARDLIERFPKLNILFNNAGIMPTDDVSSTVDAATVNMTVATNLLGPIRMSSALIEHLKAQPDAVIINNTSVLAYVPIAMFAVYSATKAALHSYTLSQRFMLRNTGVRVREIVPPWVDTDLVYKSGDPRAMQLEPFVEQVMAGLATEVEEVVVEQAKPLRDNPGPNEHAFVNGFNQTLIENPVPLG